MEKLAAFVRNGGDAVITTGFLKGAEEALHAAGLTEAHLTGRTFDATRYHVTGDYAGYIGHQAPIRFPEIVHGNNASWSLLNGGDGDLHTPIFLRSAYGKGRLYILAVPEHDTDLYRMPRAAVDVIKRTLSEDVYATGRDFSLFTYEDGSMLLYRYVKGDNNRAAHVTLHSRHEVSALVVSGTGEKIPVHPVTVQEDFETFTEWQAEVVLEPGIFYKGHWE